MRRLVHFPAAREAPSDIVAGLRRLDPSADLVYFGEGAWLLGRVRPNALRRQSAINILDRAIRGLSAGAQLSPMGRGRIQLALLALQGFAPVEMYYEEPSYAIVNDFQRALWMLEHTSDRELFDQIDAPREQAKAEARADLRDEGRARDAWRYLFTRSHAVTRRDATVCQPTRSGFTTIKRLGGVVS